MLLRQPRLIFKNGPLRTERGTVAAAPGEEGAGARARHEPCRCRRRQLCRSAQRVVRHRRCRRSPFRRRRSAAG